VDQGSGCHLDLTRYDLRHETTVQQILADGVDAVLFSGDKLLGGPQAGIVVGTHSAIAGMRHHPLRRAVRPDKNSLAVLAATLDAYLAGRPEEIPLYRLLAAPASTIRSRARRIARRLQLDRIEAGFRPSRAVIGGGTTPDQTVPSWAVTIPGGEDAADRLRRARPAVIGRVEEDLVVLDLKAIFAEQDAMLARSVATALAG
jgi:L-seryl-tRNA(Ser) seleniumtransferase